MLSVALSIPIVMVCYSMFYTLFQMSIKVIRSQRGIPEEQDIERILQAENDDNLEWPALIAGSSSAMLILFSVAGVAYYKDIRIGATFLLLAAILGILNLLEGAIAVWIILKVQKRQGNSSSNRVPSVEL